MNGKIGKGFKWSPKEIKALKDGISSGKLPDEVEIPGRSAGARIAAAYKLGYSTKSGKTRKLGDLVIIKEKSSKPGRKGFVDAMDLDTAKKTLEILKIKNGDEFIATFKKMHGDISLAYMFTIWSHRGRYAERISRRIAELEAAKKKAVVVKEVAAPVGTPAPGTVGRGHSFRDVESYLAEILNEDKLSNQMLSENNRKLTELLTTWKSIQELLTNKKSAS